MNMFGDLKENIAELIVIVTKFTRYSENDIVNAAFDSLLDDYYYDNHEVELKKSVLNLQDVIKKHRNEFTQEEFDTMTNAFYNIHTCAEPNNIHMYPDMLANYESIRKRFTKEQIDYKLDNITLDEVHHPEEPHKIGFSMRSMGIVRKDRCLCNLSSINLKNYSV